MPIRLSLVLANRKTKAGVRCTILCSLVYTAFIETIGEQFSNDVSVSLKAPNQPHSPEI